MPWIPLKIVLRNFYHSLFRWCKHSLDIIAEGDYLDCDEARALEIIHGLSSYFVYDHSFDTVIDRLATIEKRMDALDLREVEKRKPNKKDVYELDGDWEPFVRISISNQDFLAFCDIGSIVSTMPKVVYDSLKFNMDKLSSYHENANGDIYEIQGRIKDVPVKFLKGIAMVDFFVMKSLPSTMFPWFGFMTKKSTIAIPLRNLTGTYFILPWISEISPLACS